MARNYSNTAVDTTLTGAIGAGDGSFVVASATGWPAAPFAAVLDPGLATEEVVQVTNKAGTTFTVTRAFDGTSASAHSAGATVRHAAIAGDFTDLQTADSTNAAAIAAEAATRAADDTTLAGLISSEASTRASADTTLQTNINTESSARATADALLTPMARTLTINGVTFDLSANRSWTISAGVSSVTASAPLASSGGATPDISLTGIVPSANGGTGTNNTGNLAWPSGGGTAALLGTANVFTAAQTVSLSSATAFIVGPNGATNPAFQVVTNVASAATGVSVTGSAAGNGVALTVLSSGTNESLNLTAKGTGRVLMNANGGFALVISGTNRAGIGTAVFQVATTYGFLWSSDPINTIGDTGFFRNAAAVVEVTNGTAGQWGALKAGTRDTSTGAITDGLTLGHQASSGTPGTGMGTAIQFNLNSSTTADQNAARITAEWATATHASRKARITFNVFDTATREGMRVEADGSNPMIGFLGANASARTAVTGSRGGNAALANLLTELATKGLITDSTTA